jgi:phage regulator Rha-like protein
MDSVIQFIKNNTIDLIDSRDLAKRLEARPGNILALIDRNYESLIKIAEFKEIKLKQNTGKPIRYVLLTKAQSLYIVFIYRPKKSNPLARQLQETLLIQMIKSFV